MCLFYSAFQWRTSRTTARRHLLTRRIQASLCFGRTARDEPPCTTSWRRTGTRWWQTWWRPSHRLVMESTTSQINQEMETSNIKPQTFPFWLLSPSDLRPLTLQGSEEMRLKPQNISTLVVSLADFVRMADRKIIANTLSQLKLELDFDSTAISQLQVVLFGFQDAVSIKP